MSKMEYFVDYSPYISIFGGLQSCPLFVEMILFRAFKTFCSASTFFIQYKQKFYIDLTFLLPEWLKWNKVKLKKLNICGFKKTNRGKAGSEFKGDDILLFI